MNEQNKDPGEAAGDGGAAHGYRNEVSWEGGKGRQPYANQGEEEQGAATAKESEGGDRGDASGRNLDQLEQVMQKEDRPVRQTPRET